jgi:hypothetical protein
MREKYPKSLSSLNETDRQTDRQATATAECNMQTDVAVNQPAAVANPDVLHSVLDSSKQLTAVEVAK